MINQDSNTNHSVVNVLFSAENGEFKVYMNAECDCYYTVDRQEAVRVAKEIGNFDRKIGNCSTFSVKHSTATAEQEKAW